MQPKKLTPPNDDKRWRLVGATMRKHGFLPSALIETLHTVQEAFGYLDDQSLRWVALNLRVPLSRVYGVATFYNYFTLKPQGEHTCVVCLGTACYIKGAPDILEAIQAQEDIKPGETSADKKVSLLIARCIGACGLAPAVVYDGEVVGKLGPEQALARINAWRANKAEEVAHAAG
ncbi:MAG: bidirectional hydrogenase complex protein HoxE [Anaerolineae bacterium]|nr:bidirectional hydrogenase complex protein HoxE [Anaerolineae bacterium]MDW8171836.1 bidirectional hydrogenase complex protein HoxE [Anaerolineae bacterium]